MRQKRTRGVDGARLLLEHHKKILYFKFMNVTKIVLTSVTKCQIFHLKCTKFNFSYSGGGGSLQCFPDPLAGFKKRKGKGKGI